MIEAKSHEGSVRVRGGELFVGGRRKSGFIDQVDRQIAAVEAALGVAGVTGFICVLRGDFPFFGRPSSRGIEVTPPVRLVKTLRERPAVIDRAEVTRLAHLAEAGLRPAAPSQ